MKKIVKLVLPWVMVIACAICWGKDAGFGVFLISGIAMLINAKTIENYEREDKKNREDHNRRMLNDKTKVK